MGFVYNVIGILSLISSTAFSADLTLLFDQYDEEIPPRCEATDIPGTNPKVQIKRCELFNSHNEHVITVSQVGDGEIKYYRAGDMLPLVPTEGNLADIHDAFLRYTADESEVLKNNMALYNESEKCDSQGSSLYSNRLNAIGGPDKFGFIPVSLQPGGSPLRLNTDVLKKQGKLTRAEDNARNAVGWCGPYDQGGGPCTILSGRLVLVTAHHLCSKAGVKNSSKHLFLPDSANHPNDKPIEIDFDKSFVAGSDGPGKCNNLRLQNPENDWAIAVLKEDIFKKYPHRGYRAMKISDQNPADYSKGDNCRFFAFHIDKEAQQDYSKYMERGCKYNNYKPSYQNYILEYFNSTQRSSGSPGTVCNGRYDERTNECLGEYELMAINVNGNLQARYQCQTTCANGSVVISNNTDVLSKLDEMKRLYP